MAKRCGSQRGKNSHCLHNESRGRRWSPCERHPSARPPTRSSGSSDRNLTRCCRCCSSKKQKGVWSAFISQRQPPRRRQIRGSLRADEVKRATWRPPPLLSHSKTKLQQQKTKISTLSLLSLQVICLVAPSTLHPNSCARLQTTSKQY